MISYAVKEVLQGFVPEENIFYEEPMKNHTTFRVGGAADCFVKVESTEQLSKLLNYLNKIELPYYICGNGSNLLVGDKGYRGIILQLADKMNALKGGGKRIYAQAGVPMAHLARTAAANGLAGLEFAAGIPGTVGGGVVMNAGAYDGEMKQVMERVVVLDKEGDELELDNETMEFGYRTSAIKNHPFVVTECSFLLTPGDKDAITAKINDFQSRRKENSPWNIPAQAAPLSAQGHFAGKLIMDAGLSGCMIGGARVSEKHSGFVINTGDATAADIRELIAHVQEEVYQKFNVRLEPEVIFLGDF